MRGLAHACFDRGKRPFWLATGFRKKERRKESNIFSPNYSVGPVLCAVECPEIGMAWWVKAGAKPHPPLTVLSVDLLSLLPCAHLQDLLLQPSSHSWLAWLTMAQFPPHSPAAWGKPASLRTWAVLRETSRVSALGVPQSLNMQTQHISAHHPSNETRWVKKIPPWCKAQFK